MGGSVSNDYSSAESNYCKSEIRQDLVKTPINNMNVVIDMSNGLNEGVSSTLNAAMKPILNKTLDKAHFYSVAAASDVKELPFVIGKEEEAYIYLTNQNNYGGAWSKLKPGLKKATEDFDSPSLFITDFILDEGGKKKPQFNVKNKKSYTTSSVEYGWAKNDGFKQWLTAGNSIHFFIYPYLKTTKLGSVETNLYYCFFIPKNINFQSSELFSTLSDNLKMYDGSSYFLVDPLAIDVSAQNIYDKHISLDQNKMAFNLIDDDNNYSVFQYLFGKSIVSDETAFEYLKDPLEVTNESPWQTSYSVSNIDEFMSLKGASAISPDPSTGLTDMANVNTLPGYSEFVNLSDNEGVLSFTFDKTAKNGFNLQMINSSTYFFSKHQIDINQLKVSEQFKVDAKKLQCVMYADGYKFQHKALYNSIIESLEEAEVANASIEFLSKPYFYKSYSIVSANPNF
jgi:hypothetical protein